MELRGSVVVVTGASSGIGEATAVAFARRGARVVLTARRTDRLEDLATRIEAAGGSALALPCDVTDTAALVKLPGIVEAMVGPTDVLVNNAGIPGGGDFLAISHEQIDRVVATNLASVLHATRAFLPGMVARGRGHVINLASLAGRFATPGAAVYSATKHAVVAFSEALSYDVEGRGVLITTVNPSFVDTESFPVDLPPSLVLRVETVADAVVKVARRGIAPEYSIPRGRAPPGVPGPDAAALPLGRADRAPRQAGDAGAAVSTAPSVLERPVAETVADPDVPWVVIVWNDPINLMSYVTWVFQKLFGYPRRKAERLMWDVHTKGKAVVSHGPEEARGRRGGAARVRAVGHDAEGPLTWAARCPSPRPGRWRRRPPAVRAA